MLRRAVSFVPVLLVVSGVRCSSSPSGGPDASNDAPSNDGGSCSAHLGAGFSQVVNSMTVPNVLTGAPSARSLAMALDENDDPMFAYYDKAADGVHYTVSFVRWDPCKGAFGAPVMVDAIHDGGPQDLAMAYDPSTKEVGITYVSGYTDNNWADGYGAVMLASMKAPATSFTTQQLSVTYTDLCPGEGGTDNPWPAGGPTIAMHGGNVYVAFYQTPGGGHDIPLVWFLSSSATSSGPLEIDVSDGGMTALGTDMADAGVFAGPHAFTYSVVPFTGAQPDPPTSCNGTPITGLVLPHRNSAFASIAVDSTGAPALAVFEDSTNDYPNFRALYWRPGMASAVAAYEFNVDADIDLTLAFDGTKPRIGGHMDQPQNDDALTIVTSPDGVTWTPVHIPDGGSAFDSSLAFDGAGHGALAADRNSTNPTCANNPFLSLSADDGATWTASCPQTTAGYSAGSINVAYGASRIAGKVVLSFVDGSGTPGIQYYQSP